MFALRRFGRFSRIAPKSHRKIRDVRERVPYYSNICTKYVEIKYFLELCMYGSTGKIVNPARSWLFSLSPFAPREFGLVKRVRLSRPVSARPFSTPRLNHQSSIINHQSSIWCLLPGFLSRFPRRRPFIYLNRHTPSGLSRVYQVTQLRTDGVHDRESAGTEPVVLKVIRVTGASF